MIDYKVGDWVERVRGNGESVIDGLYYDKSYKVIELSGGNVRLEGVTREWSPACFKITKNSIVRNLLTDLLSDSKQDTGNQEQSTL